MSNNYKIFSKKGISLILAIVLIISCIVPIAKVIAATYGEGDNFIRMEINNELGFTINEVTVNGNEWTDGDDEYRSNDNTYIVIISVSKNGDAIPKVQWGGNWNDYISQEVSVVNDVYTYTLNVTDDEQQGFLGLSIIEQEEEQQNNNENNNENNPVYDSTAYVNLTISGVEIENPYGEDASEIRVGINYDGFRAIESGNVTNTYTQVDGEQRISSLTTNNPMGINYSSTNNGKIVIGIRAQWNTYLTNVVINNVSYANQLPKTKNDLINCYENQELRMYFEVDETEDDTYNIEIVGRKQTEDEIIMGNFLWDYNEEGYTSEEDKILNATLEFIKVEFNGETYDSEEINNIGGLYAWNDAERKEVYTAEWEGVGSATFPVGAMLTVAIIPDAGYQLVRFGVNDGGFEPQEEIGVYTFEIQGGNFHLQALVQGVDDEVNTDDVASIENGTIEFSGIEGAMSIGTARLDIKDVELSEEQISNFENAAGDYEIQNYIDISLYNTVYKGSKENSWDTQVDELENDATITLQLSDDVDYEDIVIVHEKHDGTYEIIEDVEYDTESNSIILKTDSFSNYAIATKEAEETTEEIDETEEAEETEETEETEDAEAATEEAEETEEQETIDTNSGNDKESSNPQTGDIIAKTTLILFAAVIVYIISTKKNRKRRVRKH